jgi:peptidoglycan/xylan/chitin deacetylase (PgdA/CDA1 family)
VSWWKRLRIPVLTYHSHQIAGIDYATNDLVALHADLRTIARAGFRIVPAAWIVEWLLGRRRDADVRRAVALTFDDGSDFDVRDLEHPSFGTQRAMINVLRDFQQDGDGVPVHATSFVIASPQVRAELDAACLAGRGWMSDAWWRDAQRSGMLAIENHTWDHNHPLASRTCQREQRKGSFEWIETEAECDAEIAQAARFIAERSGTAPTLLAYPFGSPSAYLRDHYLPRQTARHGMIGAFAADGGYVTRRSSRWCIERFVFGAHWTEPGGLERILKEAV